MTAARGTSSRSDRVREESARAVLRCLRHGLERGQFSRDDAIHIAMVQLSRPGRPAARLSTDGRTTLHEAIRRLAATLDPSQPRALLAFARGAADAACALVKPLRHPGADMVRVSDGSAAQLARAAVWAEAARARDADDHVRRAVTRALRERGKSRGLTRIKLEDGDLLRAVLDVPQTGRVALPRSDVRARIADAADRTAFGDALRKAARFSEEIVRPVLGEELWSLARPVAFSDKAETSVVIEVRSAVVAHEVRLRSQEIVHRLRALPLFAAVRKIRVVVVENGTLPIVPARPSRSH